MARLKRRRFARFLAVCWPPASCAGILLLFCCLPKVIVRCEFEFCVSSFLFMTSVSFFSFVFKSRGLLPLLVGVIGPLLPITTRVRRVAYYCTCSKQAGSTIPVYTRTWQHNNSYKKKQIKIQACNLGSMQLDQNLNLLINNLVLQKPIICDGCGFREVVLMR